MSEKVVSTLRYATNDSKALINEKAYILNYTAPPEIPKTNFKIDFFPGIEISDLRTASLNWDDNGLKIAKLRSCMPQDDFKDEEKIEKLYLPEVHDCIRRTLGAEEVCIFDYMVRRREPAFPYQSTTNDNAPQPALSAHIDYTTDEIQGRVKKYFKEKAEEYGERHYQIINVWKPLNGPLRDYPMAYCDAKTMDPATDLMVVDEVFPTVANEVYQVLYSPRHKWYYIPDQQDNEVAIFAGYDSRRGQALSVPHCSFDLGDRSSGAPRQSIEVRAFVFYKDE
ncbi:putative Methyltransferase [Seiridium cardinale]|uniref:Methyltransferase n=1 Tax=Seiridium cardinale TaxID=138064 RepID=A0ABR2XMV5_9PEZI